MRQEAALGVVVKGVRTLKTKYTTVRARLLFGAFGVLPCATRAMVPFVLTMKNHAQRTYTDLICETCALRIVTM